MATSHGPAMSTVLKSVSGRKREKKRSSVFSGKKNDETATEFEIVLTREWCTFGRYFKNKVLFTYNPDLTFLLTR
jgi:hypothetical protein